MLYLIFHSRVKEVAWTAKLLFLAELSRYLAKAYQDTPNHTIAWQAQAELDDLIASECVFCGDLMIRLVDENN